MRVLLLFFLIYLNYVVCLEEHFWYPKKPYPKKAVPEWNRNLHLRRYMLDSKQTQMTTKKKMLVQKEYTVFPLTGTSDETLNIPESPYFPLDDVHVKRELSRLRTKRSIDDNDINVAHIVQRRKRAVAAKKGSKPAKNGAKKKSRRSGKTQKSKSEKGQPARSKVTKKKAKKEKEDKKKEGSKKKAISRRLIYAKDAFIEDYPYTVSIQKGRDHWCSGALLNQRLVITTANCVWKGQSMSRMKVRAGSRYVNRGGQTAKVQEMMRHPKWSIRGYPDNDVALLLLDTRIRFSHGVHGVDLPNRIMLPPFNDVWVSSYGANRRDGLYPDNDMTLQVYHADLMDRGKCNNVTQRFGVTVSDNFVCLSQRGRRAPCTRDTGAPAVSDGVVWALASWGIRKLCGTERFPAVFSYLASQSNMDFIANATKVLMSDERPYPFLDRLPLRTVNRFPPTTKDMYYTGQH